MADNVEESGEKKSEKDKPPTELSGKASKRPWYIEAPERIYEFGSNLVDIHKKVVEIRELLSSLQSQVTELGKQAENHSGQLRQFDKRFDSEIEKIKTHVDLKILEIEYERMSNLIDKEIIPLKKNKIMK